MNGEGLKFIAFIEKNQCMATVKTISLQHTKLAAKLSSLKIKTDAPFS